MKSVFNYLVSPKGKRTTGEIEIDGKELLLNTELQNHEYTNRIGIVSGVPLIGNSVIQNGDEVIVHHNVFRRFRDIKGKEKIVRTLLRKICTLYNPIKSMPTKEMVNGNR
jgi:hypothetical protein